MSSLARLRIWSGSAATAMLVMVAGCDRPEVKPSAPPPQIVFVSNPTEDEVSDFEDFTGRTDAIFSVDVRAA